MSLLPLLFSNWWENLERPHHILHQDFGSDINPEILLPRAMQLNNFMPSMGMSMSMPKLTAMNSYKPLDKMMRPCGGGISTVKADKDKFCVHLDVQQFEPDDINVKVVDHFVIVEGKHEERQDEHGWVSRQFMRKYMIPEQCDIDQTCSKLSSDGVLTIIVPRKEKSTSDCTRVINIEHTGKPSVCQMPKAENKREQEEEEEEKPSEEKPSEEEKPAEE